MRAARAVGVSLRTLTAQRLRTALALVSVGAGVAVVVVTSAIGTGIERGVQQGLDRLGANLLVVRPATIPRSVARREIRGAYTSLRPADAAAIASLPAVGAAAPGFEGAGRIKAGPVSTLTRLLGTTAAYREIRRFTVARGRFLDADDDREARRVVVLGDRVARSLFTGDPVGHSVRIRGVPYQVIGVLAPKGMLADGDEDDQAVVPIRTAQRRLFNLEWLNVVFVSAREADSMAATATGIAELLAVRHRTDGGRPDFEVQNSARYFAMQQQATGTLSRLTTSLGGLAFAIGGTGILAVMLLSVRERTPEIGIRLATGATPGDVLVQFLLEAAVLAVGGWSAGLLLGAAGAGAVALFTSWPVAVPAQAIAGSLVLALATGLGFGAVPAGVAARVSPARALLTP